MSNKEDVLYHTGSTVTLSQARTTDLEDDLGDLEPLVEEKSAALKEQAKKEKVKGITSKNSCEIRPGSRAAGIVGQMAATFGMAILGLPYNLKQSGLLVGASFIIFGALLNYLSIRCLMHVSYRKNVSRYGDCIFQVFGSVAGKFFENAMAVYIFCSFINYHMTGAQFTYDLCKTMGWLPEYIDHPYFKTVQVFIFATLIFPIGCKRDLYALRHATTLSLIIIFYILIVVLVQFPFFYLRNWSKGAPHINLATFDKNLPNTFAITTFAYICQTNIFQVRNELRKTREEKMDYVNKRSNLYVGAFYMTVAVVGYLSFLDTTPVFLPTRPPLTPNDPDYLMLIGKFAMTFSIGIIAIAIRVAPARDQFFAVFGCSDKQENPVYHYGFTALIIYGAAVVAICFPDVYSYLSFVGGTLGVLISILFPCGAYVATIRGWPFQKVLAVLACILGVGLGFTAGYLSLSKMASSKA